METLNERSFERFFRDEHSRILGVAVALSGDREAARDATQEAFARCYREWAKVRTLDAPGAWLRRVVINLLIDRHRRRERERRALERYERVNPTAVELADPVAGAWWDAVRQLPDRQRSAIALHYLDGLSVAEVANVLGVAEGTVKSSLAAARRSLTQTLRISEVG